MIHIEFQRTIVTPIVTPIGIVLNMRQNCQGYFRKTVVKSAVFQQRIEHDLQKMETLISNGNYPEADKNKIQNIRKEWSKERSDMAKETASANEYRQRLYALAIEKIQDIVSIVEDY